MATQRIDIIINGKNSLSSALKTAAGDVRKLGADSKTASTGLSQMGTKGVGATGKLKTGLSSVKSMVGDLKSGFSSLGGVMTSVLAGFTFAEMVQSAGDVESKWNRIGVATGKTGAQLKELKGTVRDISNYYGISNGELSGIYEKAVRFYGASDDTLSKVKGIAATSKTTGLSVEEIYNAFVSGELGRNRQLQKSVLTEEQRNKYLSDGKITQDEINQILAENQALVEEHPELINDTNSAYARMENAINKIKNTLGTALLPVMEKLANWIEWGANKFSEIDKYTGGWLSTITAVGIALVALGAPLALVYSGVKKVYDGFTDVLGKVKDFVLPSTKKVKIDCTKDKDCTVAGSSAAAAGGIPWASVLGGAAVVAAVQGTAGYASKKAEDALGMGKSGQGIAASGTGPAGLLGYQLGGGKIKGLSTAVSMMPVFGQIFSPIVRLWENAAESITSGELSKWIKDKIPKLNWKWPNIGSVGKWIRDQIPKLNWKWPTLGSIGKWVRDRIPKLNWKWPSLGSVGQWIRDKVPKLGWKPPTLTDIKNLISAKIGEFHWPWGPRSATGTIPRSQYREVRGPLSDTVASTMSNRSGVGQGYIANALSKRFSGVSAFRDIAEGIAAPLGYEFYFGDQKSNQQVWDSRRCNCYDGAQFLMAEASQRFGLPVGMSHGLWNGTSIGHVWSTIGGQEFDMAAKLLRGSWLHPSGPKNKIGEFARFMDEIGPALEYMGYGGHGKDPISAVLSGGNCFDMTLGIMSLASGLFGLPAKMRWGTYDGNSHVWANIAGKDYDLSRRALENTYTPPPRGPHGPGGGTVIIQGDVYGFDDFQRRVEQANNRIVRGY